MSKHNNKTKKTIEKLEAIRENKEAAEVVKAELLEHNNVFNLHDDAAPIIAPVSNYIKDPEDMARIARNSVKTFDTAVKKASPQSFLTEVFELQMQTMNSVLEFWSSVLGGMGAENTKPARQ